MFYHSGLCLPHCLPVCRQFTDPSFTDLFMFILLLTSGLLLTLFIILVRAYREPHESKSVHIL